MKSKWTESSRHLMMFLLLIGVLFVLYNIRALFGPLIIASLLAYILNPAVIKFRNKFNLSQNLSVLVIYVIFLLIVLTFSISIVPVIIKQARSLTNELQILRPQIESVIKQPPRILGFELPIEAFYEELQETSTELFKPDRIFRMIRGATTNLVWVLVIFVTAYYLLLDWEKLREWLIQLAPARYQEDIRHLHCEIKKVWHAYLRGQLLLMTLVGLISGVTALAIGLPRAALVGLLAGFLDFIPSVGPIVATAVAAFIAWLEGSHLLSIPNHWFTIIVIVLFALIQLFENVWLQPSIIGHRLNLHRGIVFVAVLGALTLGSAILALIIVPIIGSLRLIGGYFHRELLPGNSDM